MYPFGVAFGDVIATSDLGSCDDNDIPVTVAPGFPFTKGIYSSVSVSMTDRLFCR